MPKHIRYSERYFGIVTELELNRCRRLDGVRKILIQFSREILRIIHSESHIRDVNSDGSGYRIVCIGVYRKIGAIGADKFLSIDIVLRPVSAGSTERTIDGRTIISFQYG